MSPRSPADPPAPAPLVGPPPGEAPEGPRPARWTDRLNAVLLLVTAGVLLASATPSVLRAAGVGAQAAPVLRAERLPRPDRPAPPPSPHPMFLLDGDEEEDDRPSPHARPSRPGPDRAGDSDPLAGGDPEAVRMGLARRDLRLFGKPNQDAPVIGEVEAGNSVMVMSEAGDWVLVVRSSAEGILMGWTRRSEIAVR